MNPVGIQELQNRPRYDLDGRRFGNTLSDDMFSIKNPQRESQHTPESYNYLDTEYVTEKPVTLEPVLNTQNQVPLPVLNKPEDFSSFLGNAMPRDFRDTGISRKKNITGDGLDWELYDIYGDDWNLVDDALEFPDNYSQEVAEWAEAQRAAQNARQSVNDLSTEGLREDLRYQRTGNERDSSQWINHQGAEYDPYYDMLVNYSRMSPRTAEQLVKMGVNRPTNYDFLKDVEDEALRQALLEDYQKGYLIHEDTEDPLMGLLNAYKYAMENR